MFYLESHIMYLKKRKTTIFLIMICIVAILIVAININYTIAFNSKKKCIYTYGVIDGHLSKSHKNLSKTANVRYEKNTTHGDKILNMMKEYSRDVKVYYYDARNNEKFSSEEILKGLEWMKKNQVRYVSISLSSKFYSKEVQNWISTNKNCITIYASYNNELNTLDYPAKYMDVIGVGASKKIEKKKEDIIVKSNKIILISDGLKFYNGNSFLTPYIMLHDTIK